MKTTLSPLLALAAALAAPALPAAAQSPAASAPASADADTTDLGPEIIVTVQKREQSLIDVPIALTAYGEEFLNTLGVTKLDELALLTPGLEIQEQSPNNPAVSLRGITTDSGEAFSEPRVAIFQDGVSISKSRGSYVELFDIERIEVAKGPQATLFGRGALIGGVNIIQNKPNLDAAEASASLRVGDFQSLGLTGVINAPIVEGQLAARVAGTYRGREGYVRNALGGDQLGGVEMDAVRASLAWAPDATFDVTAIFNTQRDDNSGTPFKSLAYTPPGGDRTPFTTAALNISAPGFEGDRPIGLDRRVNSGTVLVDWSLSDAFTLSAITGFRDFESLEIFDPDGSQNPIVLAAEDAKGSQWSQELRLNFDDGGPVSWFVGASWLNEEGRQRVPLVWDERFVLGLATGVLARPTPQATITDAQATLALQGLGLSSSTAAVIAPRLKTRQYESFTNFSETTAIDLYGDVTVAITPQLEVSAGLRWTQDDKSSRVEAGLVNGGSILGTVLALPTLPSATQTAVVTQIATTGTTPLPLGLFTQPTAAGGVGLSGDFDDLTWRLVARYALSDDLSLWASYARGRRPDVISATPGQAPGSTARASVTPAEEVDSFEIGLRGQALGGDLRYDASVFNYEYSNFQTTAFQGLQIVTINAGSASSTGFEGSVFWRAGALFEAFGNYAYNDAQFDSGARQGNRFRLSPEHSVALGATVSAPLWGQGVLRVTPSVSYQSKVFFDDNNDRTELQQALFPTLADTVVDEFQDAYTLVNLRVAFEPEGSTVEIGAYVSNLTDEEYILDAGNTGDTLGLPTFVRGAPRTVGFEIKARY